MSGNDVITREEFIMSHRTCESHLDDNDLIAIARIGAGPSGFVMIVAVVEFSPRGKLKSWRAYWGPSEQETKGDIARDVARNGYAMSQSDGMHFFPRLDGTFYR